MEYKNYTINLKTENIKTDYTSSGRLIDKIAMSIDQWTEEDLYSNNIDYQSENFNYVIRNFDMEKAFIEYLNKMSDDDADVYVYFARPPRPSQQKLKFGAYLALNLTDFYQEKLEEFEQDLKDNMYQYYDSKIFDEKAPELKKELEEAEKNFWKDLEHGWLYGDRSESGLIEKYQKSIQAKEVNYDQKKDIITITIDPEDASELIYGDGTIATKKETKEFLISEIENGMSHTAEKNKTKSEERRIEWQKKKAIKEAQAKKDEEERKAKLLAMIK